VTALHGDRRCNLALDTVRHLLYELPGLPLHFLLEDLVFLALQGLEHDVQDEEEQRYRQEDAVKNKDVQDRVVRHHDVWRGVLQNKTRTLLFKTTVAVLQVFTLSL
jgi:hypothetical protein